MIGLLSWFIYLLISTILLIVGYSLLRHILLNINSKLDNRENSKKLKEWVKEVNE